MKLVFPFEWGMITATRILTDNYSYAVSDNAGNSVLIDAADISVLGSVSTAPLIAAVLTTHHHRDHSGGNSLLMQMFPDASFYGSMLTGSCVMKHGDEIHPLPGRTVSFVALHTPCHTQDHICYLLRIEGKDFAVFTGDTLFVGGCGRFFEGTPGEMHHALSILGALPNETRVFPGHEYAIRNWEFGLYVEKTNTKIKKKLSKARLAGSPFCSLHGTIGEEKETNPFMRIKQKSVKKFAKAENPETVLGVLRKEKNSFK
ncbi:MAG: hydroxyacylglutathione hydrolase [Amphiamblys sp. WSBS2006]|nr:MAG: hydroxyacylglutathione hydrolase [Amphiamblys sp. WSBS2006]